MHYERDLLEVYYHNILNGFSPFVLDGDLFLAKHITSTIMFKANAFALLRAQELKKDGFANEYDLLKSATERGLWDPNNIQKIANLQKEIKIKTETLQKLAFPSQAKTIELEIKHLNNQIKEIKEERQKLLIHSLEYKILLEKRDFLVSEGVYTSQTTRLWNSYDNYLENDAKNTEKIGSSYYSILNELNSYIIRAIARETDARIRLKTFPLPDIQNVSILMIELKQWCDFYNSIYELADRPNEDIIENDEKLDGWLLSRKLKNQVQNSVNSGEGKGFTGLVTSKEDMQHFNGVATSTALALAKK